MKKYFIRKRPKPHLVEKSEESEFTKVRIMESTRYVLF